MIASIFGSRFLIAAMTFAICAVEGCTIFSRSTRTTCWWRAIMRVLTIVGNLSSSIESEMSILPFARSSRSFWPLRSFPIIPMTEVLSTNSRRLRATLAAPPGKKLSPVTSTTGTGASGEIRPTFPQTNSSSIRSPMTKMRFDSARSRICRSLFKSIKWAACDGQRKQTSDVTVKLLVAKICLNGSSAYNGLIKS